jgi:hypothetical protein
MRKWEHTGTMVRRPGSGRRRASSVEQNEAVINILQNRPFSNAEEAVAITVPGSVRGTKNVRYVDSTDRSGRFSVNMWAWISVDCPVVILHVEERLTSAVYTLTGTKNDSL